VELVKAMSIRNSPAANEVIPFEAMISDILSRFHHSPGFSRLDVKVRCALKADFIGNRYVVETILQNLVENAIKYQNTNRDSFLLIDVSESEGYVEIKVEDNGIGMDKAIREKVFDMYFRGTEISSGSGLGLYLVKIGVEKLKGQISLESESLKGARFTIRLPRAVPAA
jgi:signal transduction histidine kinase